MGDISINDFGKRIDGPGGRRVSPRDPLLVSASIITLESSHTVSLLDISPIGAKIRCAQALRVGQDVWIKSGPVNTLAQVMWCEKGLGGIQFDEELTPREIDHLRALGKGMLVTRMTPEEQQAAQDWATGMAR